MAIFGIGGAIAGGCVAGGFEGVLVGSALLWFVASFTGACVERLKEVMAQEVALEQARRREERVEAIEDAEDRLQTTLNKSPVDVSELRAALETAREAGAEARSGQLTGRATALLELLERAQHEASRASPQALVEPVEREAFDI